MNHEEYRAIAEQAARMAGTKIVSMLKTAKVREKAAKDLVTDADIAAEKLIAEHFAKQTPDCEFLGEESSMASSDVGGARKWIVDPIDGTVNYAHGLPNFAVSIGLAEESEVQVGVVYDPCADEMFSAIRGGGAFVNGLPIQPSTCRALDQALVAASFPPQVQRDGEEIRQFIDMLMSCQSIRRLGSAALNLCFVACGRIDGYWASQVKSWDVAAGQLIASEAGAVLSDWTGSPFSLANGSLCVAASGSLHEQLIQCLHPN